MNKNLILDAMQKHNKEPVMYRVYCKDDKFLGTVFCSSCRISFGKTGFNGGLEIINYGSGGLSFWSDFAEKDETAKRISGIEFGMTVSSEKFISDMKDHMPYHLEWILWNLL